MRNTNAALSGAILVTALILFSVPAASAAGTEIANMTAGATAMVWQPAIAYERMVLTVSGPYGAFSQEFDSATMPSLDLFDVEGYPLPDGAYKWELRAQPVVGESVRKAMAKARDTGDYSEIEALRYEGKLPTEPMVTSGAFRVESGAFVNRDLQEDADVASGPANASAAATVNSTSAPATVLANNDGVVRLSLCVGVDCENSPSFGADTIRLKENNLRIHFDDTSNSGSFPNTDWRLTANDTTNGGRNIFLLDDATNGRSPFAVEANAPTNALYVEASSGDIGMGTSEPVVELHIVDGDTPTLRLEQDGSSGFNPQTWDVAGNETNFFVRDVTNGSKLGFKILPNAPENSLVIKGSTGDVGVGTNNPSAPLHVRRTGGSSTAAIRVEDTTGTAGSGQVLLTLENNGPPRFDQSDTNSSVTYRQTVTQTGDGRVYRILDMGDADIEFELRDNGELHILGAMFTGGGTCGSGCDLVFDPGFELETIEEHSEQMWDDRHLPAVGPTEENGRWNISQKTGGILHELEVAHIYIEQLNGRLNEKEQENADLEARLAALEQVVQTLAR